MRVAGACLVLVMTACSSQQPRQERSAPVSSRPQPGTVTTPQPPPQPGKPQVSAHRQLLEQADAALARGDYESALALLERAQRIEPDNGLIYLKLANTYLASGEPGLARATAERGLLYCSSNAECAGLRELTR